MENRTQAKSPAQTKVERPPCAMETELKFALPTADASELAARLAQLPLLAHCKPHLAHLHNIYFDTPEQDLRGRRVALRIRRSGSAAHPQWLQTLKTGGGTDSALSQRGEWELPVPGAAVEPAALEHTPWSGNDPDGSILQALEPCFATTYERTIWPLHCDDGSVVEVALDIGSISAGGQDAAICELELELQTGTMQTLFKVAQQIARSLPLLPLPTSKAERGYALLQGTLDAPRHAQAPRLAPKLPRPQAAQQLLHEMFGQFIANLQALRTSDDPELIHQARVGWRRFTSVWRLFRKSLAADALPSRQALRPLLDLLGEVRNLDVARGDTLPPLEAAFVAGDAKRGTQWQALAVKLQQSTDSRRQDLRQALEQPAIGACLLAISAWLEESLTTAASQGKTPLPRWAKRRLRKLQHRLQEALEDASSPDSQHRARILSKRLRYGSEALRAVLPTGRMQAWHALALRQQTELGDRRDLAQAALLAEQLHADRALVGFLRGVAAGREPAG